MCLLSEKLKKKRVENIILVCLDCYWLGLTSYYGKRVSLEKNCVVCK